MTKIEKKAIQEMDAKLWNDLQERSYNLVTENLPFGCGYDVANKYIDTDVDCARALFRWCAVNDMMKELKVNPDYDLYGDYSHKLWMYANDRETR